METIMRVLLTSTGKTGAAGWPPPTAREVLNQFLGEIQEQLGNVCELEQVPK